ncbi:MAG: right-handed parallel beta-helix repeat-containing protein [Promethearchaeota archaeon]
MKMKRKSSILFGILTFTMIFTMFTLTIGPVLADSPTFVVSPSGGDDTANIQDAFDAAIAAGPGSTVQLTSGQFYTNEIIVENFYGTFKGTGKDLTKIDVLRGLDPGAPGVSTFMGSPHIFSFVGGDVLILDISFDITPYEPAEQWGPPPPDGWWYDLLSVILIAGDINSQIEDIKFKGHEGTALYDPWHPLFSVKSYNVRVGVEYGGGLPTTGRHVITNCEFNSLWLGITAYGLIDCELAIKSNLIQGGAIGIINADNGNSKFEISHNDIEANAFAGIWVMQFAPSPCQWLITHNIIRPSIMADGVCLEDYTGLGSLDAVISHNKIICDTFWGGIWTTMAQDALVINNIIFGTVDYGIACYYAYNTLLLGNNVQNVDASWAHIVLLWSSECVVVGGSTKTNVLDVGGYNNIIVGMNNMQGNSPGPEIQEALEQKMELLKSFPKF